MSRDNSAADLSRLADKIRQMESELQQYKRELQQASQENKRLQTKIDRAGDILR
jgi:outer membrane murein-binding lipoprotein Lpp